MKIVITGALGHIGSYILRDFALKYPNNEIILIDNLATQRYTSLFNLPYGIKYAFIEANIIDFDFEKVITKSDIVINLAAITDAAGSFDKEIEIENNNYGVTKKIAEACLKKGANLITMSSTSVYGTQNDLVDEDCSLDELRPQSPYAVTKLKEEKLIIDLCTTKGLKAVVFRFGTIFGISQGIRFHTAVNKFCWQAVMKHPITVWTTAYDQKRPYLDLIDASNAFSFVIDNELFNGEIYNVLTLNATVRQIVETINIYVPKIEVKFVDNKIMNQLSYEVSCSKFIKKGFKLSGNLDKSIRDTIELLKNSNI